MWASLSRLGEIMRRFSGEEGERLVREARNSIELFISSPIFNKRLIERRLSDFDDEIGVFVSIEHYPTGSQRGRMGFIRPIGKIKKLLPEAAIAASTEDPRHVPISHLEFDEIIVEVDLLTRLIKLAGRSEDIKKSVKIGRDGLMLTYGYHSNLILPMEAISKGWNAEDLLNELCEGAGLEKHLWKSHDITIYKFHSQVFKETSPRGIVREIRP